ncbi:MAG: outer membrane protein assembly factor BamD [Prevotella sp.]|jgi:outer membrane protein assembly factor BamD|nr:outer membrane protein assembly factor BamD [Prevotella sp.]MCH3993643.1 outer membrane protein assembly factor BamD [Prevotella sp.]
MKKSIFVILSFMMMVVMLTSCGHEFNQVYKTSDYAYKYEYAKECFANGKYSRAVTLLQELVTIEKGTDNAQESLYMLAMAEYCMRDYETASDYFKKYYQSYPKGVYAEMAEYYAGESLYQSTPEPRLDQSKTVMAIAAFQEYLDLFPDAKLKKQAQNRLFQLQDKLVTKEYDSAKLYYDLGSYFGNCTSGGNNYEACIVTAQNALNDYPYSNKREDFSILIMKSKFELAKMSVPSKQYQRFEDAEDECYGFLNEYPDSKLRVEAQDYISKCKDFLSTHKESNPLQD